MELDRDYDIIGLMYHILVQNSDFQGFYPLYSWAMMVFVVFGVLYRN